MVIAFVLGLVVVTVVVLATECLPVEAFCLGLMVLLVVTGVLEPQEAFNGFASPVVIMVACVMLLTGAIVHNGAAELIAGRIRRLAGAGESRAAALMLASVNVLSAFINNVAATAVFIPVAEGLARRFAVNRARYLMPVAYASMTGGMCTLVGTSTNVAVAGAMALQGLEPLGFFELTPVGVLVAVLGGAYLWKVAPRLLPERVAATDEEPERRKRFVSEVRVRPGSTLAGRRLEQARLEERFGVGVLAILRGERRIEAPGSDETIEGDDQLLVHGPVDRIRDLGSEADFEMRFQAAPDGEAQRPGRARTVELTVSYNSPLIGKTLHESRFRNRYALSVFAIHRGEEFLADKVGKIALKAGDVLLAYGAPESFERLPQDPTAFLVEGVVHAEYDAAKALQSVLLLLAAIVVVSSGLADTSTALLGAVCGALALSCLPTKEIPSYLNLRFLVMLAAMTTLGVAVETSGAAESVADAVFAVVGDRHPLLFLAGVFALTVALTQPLNNAAAALLVLPLAVHAATRLSLDPRPFAVAVAVAASCSFLSPFEPACLLVYATGHYRFRDFIRVGIGLTLIAGTLSLLLVPLLWPLGG